MIKWRKTFISIWRTYRTSVSITTPAGAVHDNTLVRYARQERESDRQHRLAFRVA